MGPIILISTNIFLIWSSARGALHDSHLKIILALSAAAQFILHLK